MNQRELPSIFGVTVRLLRQKAGLSQEKFADLCGLHRTYIGSIERGEKNVTLQTAKKIADVLNMKLSDLIVEMESNAKN